MKKAKDYPRVFFPFEVIRAVDQLLEAKVVRGEKHGPIEDLLYDTSFRVSLKGEDWSHDSFEEFGADYRSNPDSASYEREIDDWEVSIRWSAYLVNTSVCVSAPDRHSIATVFEIFESARAAATVPLPPPPPPRAPPPLPPKPIVFIGHGGSPQWRELKDHLQDKHSVRVEAYEVGSRAGHTIRDVLDDMLTKSSMALLVLTAEDEVVDPKDPTRSQFRARQNVVHETGLFQGRLGFSRAIVLLEHGAEEFSILYGIQQLRFGKGNIKEVFGDVLAVIRREFPNAV
jgi:hypothetical protein